MWIISRDSSIASAQTVVGESLQVIEETPATGFTFQVTLSGSAQQLESHPAHSVTISNLSSNSTVYVGFSSGVSSSTGFVLEAGDKWDVSIDNSDKLWVIGTASDVISVGGVK